MPNVLVYNAHIPKREAVIRCLTDEPDLNIDRPLKWEELSDDTKEYLDIGESTGFQVGKTS